MTPQNSVGFGGFCFVMSQIQLCHKSYFEHELIQFYLILIDDM